jgi:hypothetical protein
VSLGEAVAELQALMPALADALERDAGVSEQERVSGSTGMSLPVNADVMAAIRTLETTLMGSIAYAAGQLNEPPPGYPVVRALEHVQRLYDKLSITDRRGSAARLSVTVQMALRRVKQALGLLLPDRFIGEVCPCCDEMIELVIPGDEGFIVPGPRVDWVRRDYVMCRCCGTTWVASQYVLLERQIREAYDRRNSLSDY